MNAPASAVELRVRYGETDQMGVVYHPNYLVWCEIGRTELMRELGAAYRDIEHAGIRLAVAEAVVRYIAPARYDDRIIVSTTLTELGSRGITFDYVITHADSGTRLATARTKLIAIDGRGRVTALPREIRHTLGLRA
ncbi:MAG TPA: thioesterase family protein [Gemmatimonadaceae bacterium]|nr:thioesterase family protein [Gemmatimonadaceae bacterium]